MYVSNGDNYIYYLNAKFEDYDIDNIAIATYRKRVAEKQVSGFHGHGGITHMLFFRTHHTHYHLNLSKYSL